ncbi:MAG: hypothetical protein KGM92_06785, partial [Acidobacteriota bacterium]|nr:hypothetical protein [Acidobacteriota bacterium]
PKFATRLLRPRSMKLALEFGHDALIVPSSLISWRGDFVAESTDRVRSAIFARPFGDDRRARAG